MEHVGTPGLWVWGWVAAGVVALLLVSKWVKVLREYERAVIFRLGRVLEKPKGPGLVLVLWPIDRMVRVSLRTVASEVPRQDVITRDNVSIKVSAVLYFRVIRPIPATIEVENYLFATSQLAQTTLRSVLGMVELDELLAERDKINQRLQEIIDRHADPWGIKIAMVEVKQVDLPDEMRRAMARQAEAEREKRAKIIHAEGEFQAAQRLADAAKVMTREPATLQLRYLQTLVEISSEKMSTVLFPIPIDTIMSMFKRARPAAQDQDEEEAAPEPH
jgi:regulator of protease activity HflC (stomatin/prohibitin superfamily)